MEWDVVFLRFPDMGEARAREYLLASEEVAEVHRRLIKRGEETWTTEEVDQLDEMQQRVVQLRGSDEVQEFYDLTVKHLQLWDEIVPSPLQSPEIDSPPRTTLIQGPPVPP